MGRGGKPKIIEFDGQTFKSIAEFAAWAVDHSHETGKVRGILCNMCNMEIGGLRDDADTADRAAKYLRASQAVIRFG